MKTARQELTDAEFSAEKVRQRALEASIQARESVTNEKRRRLEAEEDAKLKSEVSKFFLLYLKILIKDLLRKNIFFT